MCDDAFSSNRRLRKTSPRWPTAEAVSTRATSPTRDAPSSAATFERRNSSPASARTSTTRPSSKRSSPPSTTDPYQWSGAVSRTTPSVRARSGVVNTSSVGRFVTWSCPQEVVDCAVFQRAAPRRPISSSVPGPVKRTASKPDESSAVARASSASMCSRQAATGSAASRRVTAAISSHRRSTSGVPSTSFAHPSVGQAITVQARARRRVRSRFAFRSRSGSARAARTGSTSWNRFGSASPTM